MTEYLSTPQEVTITIRLVVNPNEAVDGPPPTAAQFREALGNLADVMLVQTEDGLYSLGYEDGISDGDVENRYLGSIQFTNPVTITTKEIS